MKTTLLLLATLGLTLGARAQSLTVERSVVTPPPQVETRTYQRDGKTVTERVTTTQVRETEAVGSLRGYKAALFITNRAGTKLDGQVQVLEDVVSSRVASDGFQVLNREVVVDAMRAFDPATAGTARSAASLDTQLTNSSSALRLAQGMGADYLLVAAIDSLSTKERALDTYGVKAIFTDSTLRITYKIIDGTTGGTVAGDVIKVVSSSRRTENVAVTDTGVASELIDQAAEKLAAGLSARLAQNRIAAPAAVASDLANVTFKIEAADLMIPDVRIGAGNTVAVSEEHYKVSPLSVTVEVDGVAVGTAPGVVGLRRGFSKLRLTREGFQPWERTVNAVPGQTFVVAMKLSPEGYARWQHSTAFLNELKNGAKLTDAQVKVLEGDAKRLEQSGYKVDLKVNTTEGLTIKQNSIFGY